MWFGRVKGMGHVRYGLFLLVALSAASAASAFPCDSLTNTLNVFSHDESGAMVLNGFQWTLAPTYLQNNVRLIASDRASLQVNIGGFQELYDGGCVATTLLEDPNGFPFSNNSIITVYNTIMPGEFDCSVSFDRYNIGNIAVNTTTLTATTSRYPDLQIHFNFTTSNASHSELLYTESGSGNQLNATYRPSTFKITFDVINFPWLAPPTDPSQPPESFFLMPVQLNITMDRTFELELFQRPLWYPSYTMTLLSQDGQLELQYSYDGAILVDGQLMLGELNGLMGNYSFGANTRFAPPNYVIVCNGSVPVEHFTRLTYDPTMSALFSLNSGAPQPPGESKGVLIGAIVGSALAVAVVSVVAIVFLKHKEYIRRVALSKIGIGHSNTVQSPSTTM